MRVRRSARLRFANSEESARIFTTPCAALRKPYGSRDPVGFSPAANRPREATAMNVGVCDFPSDYEFPPRGYGSIERWLWAAATGARAWGARVHLLGPGWRTDLPPGFGRRDVRLENVGPGSIRERNLHELALDLLIVGHEYPGLPAWRRTWRVLGCDVATFQHDSRFRHRPAHDASGV